MRAAALILALAACDKVVGLDPIAAPKTWRKSVTLTNNTGVTLQDFVVSITPTGDVDLAAHAADANAIEFLDTDGNRLDAEIQFFGKKAGDLDSWVHVPMLPSGQTVLWLVYGEQDLPATASPWSSPYAAVWHQSSTTKTEFDRGPNGHDLTASSAIPQVVGGVVGNSRSFDGTETICDGHINAALDFDTSSFSYTAWVNVTALPSVTQDLLNKGGSSSGSPGYDIEIASASTAQLADNLGNHLAVDFATLPTNKWVQLAVVVDRGQASVTTYVDGVMSDTKSIAIFAGIGSPTPLCIGGTSTQNRLLVGLVDEVRVYDSALSVGWIRLENQNFTDRPRVLAIGDEQTP